MADLKTKIEDALNEASSFATAVHLAASAMESYAKPAHICALLLLAEQIGDRIDKARSALDDIKGGEVL